MVTTVPIVTLSGEIEFISRIWAFLISFSSLLISRFKIDCFSNNELYSTFSLTSPVASDTLASSFEIAANSIFINLFNSSCLRANPSEVVMSISASIFHSSSITFCCGLNSGNRDFIISRNFSLIESSKYGMLAAISNIFPKNCTSKLFTTSFNIAASPPKSSSIATFFSLFPFSSIFLSSFINLNNVNTSCSRE